jgi:glutathione S-transferase
MRESNTSKKRQANHMKTQYKLYGWKASHFAGKIRGYLNYKGIDYSEKQCSIVDMKYRIPKNTGAVAMPAIETQSGEWLADTPLMMDALEERHPTPSIAIKTPRQRTFAELFENWIDDAWLAVSLHTRWSFPENYEQLLREEGGKNLLPYAPRFLRNKISDTVFLGSMSGSKVNQGVTPEQIPLLERWATHILDLLDIHFQQHAYLLGGRPTVADYGLLGTMYGHLNRDPWPKREWLDPRPNLQAWVERTHSGQQAQGDLLPDDQIPETLLPIIDIIGREFLVSMSRTAEALHQYIKDKSLVSGQRLPRTLRNIRYPMADGEYTRNCFTYSLWRMQRIQKKIRAQTMSDQASAEQWCRDIGWDNLLNANFGPELERDGLVARLA